MVIIETSVTVVMSCVYNMCECVIENRVTEASYTLGHPKYIMHYDHKGIEVSPVVPATVTALTLNVY